jgi:hypothetical protein
MRGDRLAAALIGAIVVSSPAAATDSSPWTVIPHPKKCVQGLYRQPMGAFAAMLFCDDAAGSTLAVICYSGNVCDQAPWRWASRFWQEELWARDVTGFGWDPDGKCLYVSTSGVYGDGGLFALDLPGKKATPIAPNLHGRPATKNRPSTQIVEVNPAKGYLDYTVNYFDAALGRPATEAASVPLGRCGKK